MEFYTHFKRHGSVSALTKLIQVMRLIFFFLTIMISQVSASSFAQKITMNVKNESMEKVFNTIRIQSGYDFFYDLKLIKSTKPVTINIKGASIEEILNICFKDQPLIYKIEDKAVMIRERSNPVAIQAPAKNIVGVIINGETKEPLSGVSIKIKATNKVAVSGENGRYSISANSEDILIFSYLGYAPQSFKVGVRTTINVALKPILTDLDEVLVVGYGTVKRGDLTGAVGSVSIKDIANAPVQSFEQALAGRVAGVNVTSNEDQPGSGMNIVIRGAGSLTQSTAPLYVIDGFPIEDFDAKSLNPDDVESISVLKDASSTAIYGARGANGVIVVQTKQGNEGMPTISYSGRMGIAQANKRMEMMNPFEFVKYELERSPSIATQVFFRDIFDVDGIATVSDLERYRGVKGVNWQDKILQNGSTNIHSLALRGGTKQTRYSVSGSIFNQGGSIINSGSKRYQGKAALIQTVNAKLRAGIDVNYSYNMNYGLISSTGAASAASSSLFYSAWGYRPVKGIGPVDEEDWNIEEDLYDSSIDQTADYRINPMLSVENELRERYTTNFRTNAWFTYNLIKDLEIKVQGGIDNVLDKSKIFYNSKTHRGTPDRPGNTAGVNGGISYLERGVYSNENTITWKKVLNKKNRFDVMGGFSLQSITGEGFGLSAQNLPNEQLSVWGLNEGIPRPNSSRYIWSTMASVFGRVNYSYDSKYLATVTYRADGSSKFLKKWGYFPSAALAWRMSRESFMKNIRFISDAKLRASIGVTGNNRVGDFSYDPALAMPFDGSYSFNNATPIPGIRQSNMGNKDLKWEPTTQADLGIDLGFLKNKIELTVDVYRKTTSDLLLNANVPFVTGFSTAYKNIGKLQNDGLEITLQTVNVKNKKISWTSSFNISFNKNKILALTKDEQFMLSSVAFDNLYTDFPYIARVGESAATFFGMIWEGVYGYEDFDVAPDGKYILKPGLPTNNPDVTVKPRPGDIKYRDVNSDGVINGNDRVNIGRTAPIHTGGFSNTFAYKGIDLNVFLQWSYGNDILNVNKAFFEGNQSSRILLNQFASYQDRWTEENTSSNIFRANGGGPAGIYSTRLIEDGSFLRLKTVALGYTLPKRLTSKAKISTVRLSASGQNLFTWTKYSGMDPEVSVRHSILTPGLDWSSYPRMRTFVFGAQVTF
jgi:TonB-linked SusC/RagA family outer membrane protein